MDVPAQIVHMGCSDIVAETDQRLWRIQVKTSQIKKNGMRWAGYQFATCKGGKKIPLTFEDCDIVALVAFEMERVMFVPVACLRKAITKRVKISTFDDEDLCRKSWDKCMDYYS